MNDKSPAREPVKFEVLAVNDANFRQTFGSFTLDPAEVLARLDEFLKGVIQERYASFKMDERIQQQLDRRIEVVVKSIMQKAEQQIVTAAATHIQKRIKEQLDAMQISITVEVKGQS